MPPNKLVRKGQQQRFYPQCTSCSNLQGKCRGKGDCLAPNVCNILVSFNLVQTPFHDLFSYKNMAISNSGNIGSSCFASHDKISDNAKAHSTLMVK